MAHTDSFYENLPLAEKFSDISNRAIYTPLPEDWCVAASDVKNSTEITLKGRYKEVNLIGASTIMALLNLKKSFSLPFIFGGDGACICIPESMFDQARSALIATRKMANDLYGIELRVGIVPVQFIRDNGFDVLVARCRMSGSFSQAAFSGGGLQFAEECLKDPKNGTKYSFDSVSEISTADFTGLECRWKNVPSAHGEIVTLIVQALGKTEKEKSETYLSVIDQIGQIYGEDAKCHPIQEELLKMTFNEQQLFGESDIRSYSKGQFARVKYWFKIRWGVLLGKFLMWSNYKTSTLNWGTYKKRLIENSDFKKFDDKLRQALSGTTAQRGMLDEFLSAKLKKKELVYGMHVADSALVTCILFNHKDAHVHLVDADKGGYALAAAQLKERLNTIKNS